MRMLHPACSRAAAVTFCLVALSLGATGCASKNPLMEEAPAAARAQPETAPKVAAAAAPESAGSPVRGDNSGVQTVHQPRFLGIFSPYRVDVQQGNFVSREMLAQLKPGMTPEQVQFALGTPLLRDIFHADRWDYLFRLQKRNGDITTSRVTIFFDNKRMVRYEGGDLPTEQDYLTQIAGQPAKAAATPSAPGAPAAPAATTE